MGNQLSNESGTKGPTRTFGRTGALGLSKSELDRRCTPSGLYPSCHWDDKAIRRLIGDGRLAARCKGNEVRKSMADQECPICFLHYPQTNVVQCCKANICTECFLQVRPQKEKHSVCPFCNNPKMFVSIAKRLDSGEIQERETKEQRMIEATIRARAVPEDQPVSVSSVSEAFGSSLEQNDAVRRARSRTMSEDNGCGIDDSATSDIRLLRQLSLSSEDRTSLEREMRAQHTHPLALQMDAEAEERRIANEREYYRNNPQRTREASLSRARMGSSSNNGSLRNRLTRINSVGRSRRFNDDSLDDMIVLEAAILLSMEEDGRNASASGDGSAAAAAAAAASNNPNPMMQQMLNGGGDSNDAAMSRSRRFRPTPVRTSSMSAIPASSSSSRFGGSLSEDEQVAMAIALSMQEQTEKSSDGEENATESSKPASLKEDTPPESAPPMRATSAPLSAAAGVASLPIVSEDDDDDDVMEEEILVMERKEFKGKASDDDSAYFRCVVEQAESETKLAGQPVSRLKEG